MNKSIPDLFLDWAYYEGVEWSDFDENVPNLSKMHWERSEKTPIINEKRSLFVYKPFDEIIGNEFLVLFEPALIAINGWDECYKNDIDKCAIVRCKFEKILKFDEYTAWIVVKIQDVININKLYDCYKPSEINTNLELFKGIPKEIVNIIYEDDNWLVTGWNAQGDCGENKWIFKSQNGSMHLVMQSYFDFDESVVYLGNIIPKK
jgi:hypothetical protein